MSTTVSNLIPTIYAGLDVVSRELIGFIPNVQRDATAESGAVNQTVRSPVVPAIAGEDISAGNVPADSGNQTVGFVDVTITKARAFPIRWTGEEQLSVTANGVVNTILRDQFAQAFRAATNEVEGDLAALHIAASRANGTAGTTPFGTASNLSDLANANRILDDNGAPASGRAMIVGGAARANLEGIQAGLFRVNEAGDQGALLRQRQMRELMGFTMGYSGAVRTHTKGTGSSATTNNAGYAIGATVITLASAGTGTILAGDVITFAGDTNQYVVASGDADVSNGGTITLAAPGLRQAIPASTTAITVVNNSARNLYFSRNALILAARQPAMPEGGDAADDVTSVTDPLSGLTFQIAVYRQYRRVKYEVGLAWGVKCVKPEHLGILLG